jgi:hypothetical protein
VGFVAGPASRTAGTKHERGGSGGAKHGSGGSGGSGADSKRQAAAAALFETPAAAALALALVGGFCIGLVVVAAHAPGATTAEALLTSLWFVAITLQFTWVLAPWHAAAFARRWTFAMTLPIFLLPHLPICKRGAGKAVGAAQGAAALVLIVRSFSMLHRMEEEAAEEAEQVEEAAEGRKKNGGGAGRGSGGSNGAAPQWSSRWGRWRRVYQGMALGWHDVDEQRVRALARGAEHAVATRTLAAELARSVAFMVGSASLMSVLPPPAAAAAAAAAAGGGGGGGGADAALAARIVLGGCSTVAGFHLFDSAWRLLMCRVNRLSVDSIIGGSLWRSESVRELWLAWNLPVQRLLLRGVYLPLRRRHGVGRVPAKLATFALSGCCHLWPCFCAGLAWEQLGCMLLFFLAQPALVAVEGVLGLRGRVWAIGVELCLMPLFVLPVLKFTDPQMTMTTQ